MEGLLRGCEICDGPTIIRLASDGTPARRAVFGFDGRARRTRSPAVCCSSASPAWLYDARPGPAAVRREDGELQRLLVDRQARADDPGARESDVLSQAGRRRTTVRR